MGIPANITAPQGAVSYRSFGSRTDVGLVREHNEDSLLVAPPLFVVCDGMGGHEAGEVASEMAIRTMENQADSIKDAQSMIAAVEAANLNVIKAPRQGIGREGMGTTMTAAKVTGERVMIAQVGDSRAYLLHNGRIQQLTRDHSLMADLIESGQITEAEARFHPNRSVITRAIGSDPYMQPDIYELNLSSGDRLLLCSDGLNAMLDDYQIEDILRDVPDPQTCADMLVGAARNAGGYDNITTIVIDIEGKAKAKQRRAIKKSRIWMGILIALVVLAIAGAFVGAQQYISNSAYLGVQDDKVTIYRGIPDEFLGMQLSSVEEVSQVSFQDLKKVQPGVAARISDNMRVDNVEEAQRLVQAYQEEIAAANGSTQADGTNATGTDVAAGTGAATGATTGSTGTGTTGTAAGATSGNATSTAASSTASAGASTGSASSGTTSSTEGANQ
ncbi:MAG: Stp1/IreP family PP2C-type Ser/Thr phosphatase [Coriobacteriia bacterium]|nr:Stp1/IreP family PP2C-type Ser/Thr phosphatase [Coriobacteriia bacterium]